jgi:GNAT superfamily N-acetyltransferase
MTSSHAAELVRFHEGLSLDTTYRRFFSPHPHLSEREVDRFTHVDHLDREALVAATTTGIIGVGRFDRLPDQPVAEVAFVVADLWQGRGIGRELFDRLAALARSLGVTAFRAETLWINQAMLGLLRSTGLPMTTSAEGSVVHVEVRL